MSSGRWPWVRGHGSEARARRHWRDGETPCEACRQAHNEAHQLRKQAKPTRARLIREWARATGRPVRDTGALRLELIRLYESENPTAPGGRPGQ